MTARAKRKSALIVLYVADLTPKSVRALANLKKIVAEDFPGKYEIEVVDLLQHPARAAKDEILAVPTAVRRRPGPVRKLIGDLSERARVVAVLQLAGEE